MRDLLTVVGGGSTPDYIFFWGHTPKVDGQVDHSCLSNWYPAPFVQQGETYPTTEHYMMAEKARLFSDADTRAKILQVQSPAAAKRLGRKVANFIEEAWKETRFDIVVAGNEAKFRQNPRLGDFLRSTDKKVLVEASPRDRIWGIGIGKDHEHARDPLRWRGLNLLGFALMEVRLRLTKIE